jgi:signal transduction histidine kinase/CheY-like chemotaxis protein
LVDYKKGTYEFIKPSADIAKHAPLKGDYGELLRAIRLYVETDVNEEFEHAFSLEQIRERVKDKIADYGGDYKRKFDGVYKWVNVRTLYNEKVAPDQVIFCFREVDQEKRQQQQHMLILRDALESARENAKEKEAFFNNVSHDMRTPLNAIIGFSELVTKYADDKDKVMDYMGKINHAGKQLLNLINDILELSRIQSGKNTLSNTEFDIEKCIRDSAALFDTAAQSQDKKYSVEIDIQDKIVYGDSLRLEQILNNLLSNAFKYSNPGDSVSVKVKQTRYMKRSKYEIVVEDTGIGMSEDFTKRIFELYARETSFSTKAISGTGLGMPIVKGLVQQMSGEIFVESKLGEGSRFTVSIPFETVNKAEENNIQKTEEPLTDLKGRRIILAEDNELNMEIATEILSMNGVEVLQAVNGEEAVHLFRSSALFSIDAILMDMQMPVMDGCEAARTIRSIERDDAKSIPIIAVTANAFAEDIQKTANAGMNGHISKPIDFKVLTKTLKDLIKK